MSKCMYNLSKCKKSGKYGQLKGGIGFKIKPIFLENSVK
jgi:hypothetical protein